MYKCLSRIRITKVSLLGAGGRFGFLDEAAMFIIMNENRETLNIGDAGARKLSVIEAASEIGVAILEECDCAV